MEYSSDMSVENTMKTLTTIQHTLECVRSVDQERIVALNQWLQTSIAVHNTFNVHAYAGVGLCTLYDVRVFVCHVAPSDDIGEWIVGSWPSDTHASDLLVRNSVIPGTAFFRFVLFYFQFQFLSLLVFTFLYLYVDVNSLLHMESCFFASLAAYVEFEEKIRYTFNVYDCIIYIQPWIAISGRPRKSSYRKNNNISKSRFIFGRSNMTGTQICVFSFWGFISKKFYLELFLSNMRRNWENKISGLWAQRKR